MSLEKKIEISQRMKLIEIAINNETDDDYLNYCAIEIIYDFLWDDENIYGHKFKEIEKRRKIGLEQIEKNPFYYIQKQINVKYLDTFNELVSNLLPMKKLINVDLHPSLFEKKLEEDSIKGADRFLLGLTPSSRTLSAERIKLPLPVFNLLKAS